jgi:hypothetical protein
MVGLGFAIWGVFVFLIANSSVHWSFYLLISGLAAAFLLPAIHPVEKVVVILSALILGAFAISIGAFYRGMLMRADPRSTSPDEAYRALIANPIPTAVTDLQGGGTTWQGYGISLRFRAPSLESAGVTQPPYVQANCTQVYYELTKHPLDPSPFVPKWKIPDVENPTCLEWSELSNEWTTLGNHSVLYADGWIFFVGSGS